MKELLENAEKPILRRVMAPNLTQMHRLSQKFENIDWISKTSVVKFSFSKYSRICATLTPLIGPNWPKNYTAPILYRNNRPAKFQRNPVKTAPWIQGERNFIRTYIHAPTHTYIHTNFGFWFWESWNVDIFWSPFLQAIFWKCDRA